MEPNVPLLRKYVEWVEEQAQRTKDREWYQPSWFARGESLAQESSGPVEFCDTAMCVAGKVAMDHNWQPVFDDPASPGLYAGSRASQVKKGQSVRETDHVAMEILGLSDSQANSLFHADNTAEDIRQIAERIAGERL